VANHRLDEHQATVYEFAGRQFMRGSPGFAETIARAHAAQQRPRCVCAPDGIETYIAKLDDGYVVKRMPGTGHRHAPTCPHFESAHDEVGLRPLLGTAIREDPSTGLITLRVDFALSKNAVPEPRRYTTATEARAADSRLPRLSLRGLLHHLWDQADLTRWHPGFEGKRSWATVRRHLQNAAQANVVGGVSLSARLYLPEPFTLADQDSIRARRSACWTRTATDLLGNSETVIPRRRRVAGLGGVAA